MAGFVEFLDFNCYPYQRIDLWNNKVDYYRLLPNMVVHWLNWVRPTGLDTALVLSLSFYVVAVPVSSLLKRRYGIGPCERVYRAFGG